MNSVDPSVIQSMDAAPKSAENTRLDEEEGVHGLMNLIMPLVTAVMEESKLPEDSQDKVDQVEKKEKNRRDLSEQDDPEEATSRNSEKEEPEEEEDGEERDDKEGVGDEDFQDEDFAQNRKRPRKEAEEWKPNGKNK